MLETAVAVQQSGVDVVVGCATSSGSDAIDRLLRGFECLPGVRRAGALEQPIRIDVDNVKRRIPAILLIDTRPPAVADSARPTPGVQDSDFWSDIEQILASGIDVWAALDATGFSCWSTLAEGLPARFNSLSRL
jgi:two-component system sensor histidine kinase KdpD